jgi:WD40 repeat protein/serine/threonine protein kinase
MDSSAVNKPATPIRRLGDYELLEEIARGGMGIVYRARQVSLNRIVALKMIRDSQLATPNAVKRFRIEAEAAARLEHPNLVPLFECGELEGFQFLSMRLIEGSSLAKELHGTPMDARRVAELMVTLARAIHYAHQRGVLHRDLKPANVLLDSAGAPHITDFGMAKVADRDHGVTLTADIIGSPNYMSPEQAAGRNDEVTTASDVYSLGAIMFELLTGRPPFRAVTPLETIRKVVEEEPTPARNLYSFVDRELETICLKCLEKAPNRRYGSAVALAEDLERWLRHEPILARPVTPAERVRKWMRRNPKVTTLLLLFHVALILGSAGILWQWRRAEKSRDETQKANRSLTRTLDHLQWRSIDAQLEDDYAGRAVAQLAERLRQEPHDWRAATYAISILEQRSFAMPLAAVQEQPEIVSQTLPAINPDGTRIAKTGNDHTIHLFDATTGKEALKPLPHEASIASLLFSPDGSHLAVALVDGSVDLWDAVSGQLHGRLAAKGKPFHEMVFSRDGQRIAVASGRFLEIWHTSEADKGHPPQTTIEHSSAVGHIRLSRDGARALTWGTSADQPLIVWDSGTGKRLFTPAGGNTSDAAIDADGNRVAVISGEYETTVWDVTSGGRLTSIASPLSSISGLAMTPDGARVVLVFHLGVVQVFSATTGLPVSKPMRHLYTISSLEMHADGKRIITGARDYKARVWDLATGDPIGEPIPHPGDVTFARFADRGNRVLLATSQHDAVRFVRAWELRRPVEPLRFQPPGARDLNAVRLSPDGKLVVVGTWTPTDAISVYDRGSARLVFGPANIEGDAYGIEFTPDLKKLVVATNLGWLYGWSVKDWRPLWDPAYQPGGFQPVAISPNGAVIATGSPDKSLRSSLGLWDVNTGKLIREMKQGSPIKGMRFSPTGDRIIACSVDGVAIIWETKSGERATTLKGHTAEVLCVEFSPDGRRVLTGSYDSTVRIWDAVTGREVTSPLRHQGEVSHASFSPDGRKVATAARDGTARIWDAQTGLPLVDWMQHRDTVQTVQFDPTGRRLVTRDQSGFRLWDTDTGEAITVHYASPVTGGVGLDSPTMRDTFSPDGRRVFLGCSMNAASLWDIPDPPAGVPAWFPDFLEAVAGLRVERAGEFFSVPAEGFLEFRQRAASFGSKDYYEVWVKRYLAMAHAPIGVE